MNCSVSSFGIQGPRTGVGVYKNSQGHRSGLEGSLGPKPAHCHPVSPLPHTLQPDPLLCTYCVPGLPAPSSVAPPLIPVRGQDEEAWFTEWEKPSLREGKGQACCHTASMQQSWDSDPGPADSKSPAFGPSTKNGEGLEPSSRALEESGEGQNTLGPGSAQVWDLGRGVPEHLLRVGTQARSWGFRTER